VVAVGNAFWAFSKERWMRSVRPRVRQLPQTAANSPLSWGASSATLSGVPDSAGTSSA
jgi:hypothetical protein